MVTSGASCWIWIGAALLMSIPDIVPVQAQSKSLLTPLPPSGQNLEKPSSDPRDLEGTYLGGERGDNESVMKFTEYQYTPSAAARAQHRRDMSAKGTPVGTPSQRCITYPVALDIDYVPALFPINIVQTPEKVVILVEEGRSIWQIFLNRDHPRDLTPSYRGDSVGRWEGDTLVVDIIGFNAKQWMDPLAGPQSKAQHMTVRIRKLDQGKRLEFVTTVEDPASYKQPFVHQATARWDPGLRFVDFVCEEDRHAEYVVEE